MSYLPSSLFSPPSFNIRGQEHFWLIWLGITAMFLAMYGILLRSTWRRILWLAFCLERAPIPSEYRVASRGSTRKRADATSGSMPPGAHARRTSASNPLNLQLHGPVEMNGATLPPIMTLNVAFASVQM